MADLKDLELLILSRYPIIAVETYEEERVEAALQAVAAKLQIPLFVWTVTDGLRRRDGGRDGAPIYDTQRPIMALANLAAIKGDGVYHFKDPVFVVATCNQIDSLPPEMMRKGRFDEIFFIDLPSAEERRQIFGVHLAKRKRDPGTFDLGALAAASEGFSGAEIEQAVVSALYTAFSGGRELETPTVLEELRATRPLSVTRAEEIAGLRAWAEDRTVPAS